MANKNSPNARFEQVFFNTGVGIMIVDKDRVLIEVNPRFCEMLGFKRSELIGKSAEIIHTSHKTFEEFGKKAFDQVRKQEVVNLEWPFKTKTGRKIWFRIAGDPVMGQEEVLWTVVDITERVEAQNRIEELASKLSKYLSPQVYRSIFSGQKNVQKKPPAKSLLCFFLT